MDSSINFRRRCLKKINGNSLRITKKNKGIREGIRRELLEGI